MRTFAYGPKPQARRLTTALSVLASALILTTAATVVSALPGPDGVSGPFEIIISKPIDVNDRNGLEEIMDRIVLQRTDGWDGGDREGYRCASVEFYDDGLAFEVTFEQLRPEFGGADWVKINDKNAPDSNDNLKGDLRGDYCGSEENMFAFDESDHFPHLIHAGDGLTFFRGGSQIARLDLTQGSCEDAYWVPGDEPGEAWMWWDEDGPTGSHNHQENDLGCGGGPIEPIPVLRAYVNLAEPDVEYCTHSAHEDVCTSEAEPEPLPSASATPGQSASPSPSPSQSPSVSPSPSPSSSPSPSPSPSPTETPSPSPTETPSPTEDPCTTYSGYLTNEDGDEIYVEVCV
jgi:hypothetical protein